MLEDRLVRALLLKPFKHPVPAFRKNSAAQFLEQPLLLCRGANQSISKKTIDVARITEVIGVRSRSFTV